MTPAGLAPFWAALARLADDLEAPSEGGGRVVIAAGEAAAITVEAGPEALRVGFAGWSERFTLTGSREDDGEALASALDFVAAALFGELRVVEARSGTHIRRTLEVRVGSSWIAHGHRGDLGRWRRLGQLLSRTAVTRRTVQGQRRRPRALADAGPSGLPAAPWSGAAGLDDATTGAAELPIDGELDLHNFSPREVGQLLPAYIEACLERGVLELRVVHGKGKGVLRRSVHALLERHPDVEDYRLGGHGEGSWGATVVRLRRRAG